ncbi:MAG TPA: hypothetical protein DCY13_23670, partial [Verrucomicrobiales bacterium]|nr:hypothetical protein [Verrucomicrobiales bacterium]
RGSYLRVYSQSGEELLETGSGAPSRKLPAGVIRHLQMAAAAAADAQQIGYFAMQVDDDRAENLYEVIITPFFEASSGKLLGSIVLGFTVTDFGERFLERLAKIQSGILINDTLHTTSVPTTVRAPLLEAIGTATGSLLENATSFDIPINGEPHRCFVRALNPGSIFPVAYHLSLYSLADQYQDLRELRLKVGAFALLVFVAGLVLAWLLSHGMAVPLRELVLGTREIEKGNYDYHVRVRSGDEIGQLADSFNTMARGLAQRDKYAVVLRQVADEAIAEKLMSGEAKVGGELRLVTVLFCDIRGFSALTQNLPADEVVRLLNEHMTALTKVVYEHQGVVDKFVGDLIMAVFGAPSSRGNDAERA